MENTENKTELTLYGNNTVSVSGALFVDENKTIALIQQITHIAKEQASGVDLDNPKELKKLSSVSREVASLKVKIDDFGKSLVEDAKKKIKVVDNNRKLVRDELDALRDAIRQPLTDFENAEKARIQAKDDAVKLCSADKELITPTLQQLQDFLVQVENLNADDYGDFAEQIAVERKTAIERLNLRIEQTRQAEENARIAEQARLAEEEKRREEEKQRYAEEQARRAVEQERQRQAEEERKKQAEQARIAAEEERRAKDTEHRRWVNNQAKDTLIAECGLDEETAKKVIIAVSQGKITHIFIKY